MGELQTFNMHGYLQNLISSQIIYNEGWGQVIAGYPEFGLTDRVMQLDPTRLVDSTSGWYDHGAGDYSVCHSLLFETKPDLD
jgi:hypothetical protein